MKKLHIYIGISITLLCAACGEMRVGKNFSYGIIKDGNSIYKGIVHHGVKNGEGVLVDSLNRTFTGIWHNDTLVSGTRVDSSGVYTGQLSANGKVSRLNSKLSCKVYINQMMDLYMKDVGKTITRMASVWQYLPITNSRLGSGKTTFTKVNVPTIQVNEYME